MSAYSVSSVHTVFSILRGILFNMLLMKKNLCFLTQQKDIQNVEYVGTTQTGNQTSEITSKDIWLKNAIYVHTVSKILCH